MARGSVNTDRPLSDNMIEALRCVARGEPTELLSERTEHGGPSYTRLGLLDRELIVATYHLTDRGREVLASIPGECQNKESGNGR